MTPFLRQVAEHYYNKGEISRRCFIFPNRRSMVFFGKYLSECVAADGCTPVIAPQMLTINDFFSRTSGMRVADRVTLLMYLYDCYKVLNPHAETLDEFIFWGDVILGDFNDTDKYLADPKQLFANVADFKNIQDSFEYLTERQREAIESFVRHFRDSSGKAAGRTKNPKATDVKESFRYIWNLMYPLYRDFNAFLTEKGLAYEGMIYRSLAERLDEVSVKDILAENFENGCTESFVFVGLNALNECEKKVMARMRDAGIAEFCWDYSGEMISDSLNKSSFFMSRNVKEYPQAFTLDTEGLAMPEFNVVSVPSSYGQVKLVPEILARAGRISDEDNCAVVLPDEGLLMPLLNSIPPDIEEINVTMGYPMSCSEFRTLMSDITRMQLHVRTKDGVKRFYHKYVWDVFSNALFKKVLDAEDMEPCRERIKAIKQAAGYYIPESELRGLPVLDVVFRSVVGDMTVADPVVIREFADYQLEVVSCIVPRLAVSPDLAVEIEFAKEYWCAVNRLKAMSPAILPTTWLRLLDSLLSGVSIPFKGEPLKGLQIMGPLETRALDFRNVVILSCNEGIFPRRSVSSSFIPPELRKGFGLPTYEYQDAVWAYYFYRLITRAEKVWLLCDSRTEGLKNGEESRYIKQLRYHFRVPLNSFAADAEPGIPSGQETVVVKTEELLERVRSCVYSPSSIQNYIDCPMRFYYYSVEKLKKEKEVAETMDPAMIGNVYHNAMWALMTSEAAMLSTEPMDKLKQSGAEVGHDITGKYLESWLTRVGEIRCKVTSLMCQELGTDEITGRNLVVASVIVRYVQETIKRDIEILDAHRAEAFHVIGLEKPLTAVIGGLKFFGVMDRLDKVGNSSSVRLSDYKSGKDDPSVLMTPGCLADNVADAIFGSDRKLRKKNKAGLQFFIYDKMLSYNGIATLDNVCNSMYATSGLFECAPAVNPLDKEFASALDDRLEALLSEIQNPDVPFRMTDDEENCRWCDFRMICGR